MRQFISFSFFLITLLYASETKADVYKCTTASGIVITSDRVIPDCANRNTKVFKNNGALKNEIAPPLTREEKKKLAEEKEKKKIAEEAEIAKQKEETYLLAHYSNEQDIEIARQKLINNSLERKKLASEQLSILNKSYNNLNEELKKTSSNSSNLTSLKIRIDKLQSSILKIQISLQSYDTEMLQINQRFDETFIRYQTLFKKK
jgi:hypothetical protein